MFKSNFFMLSSPHPPIQFQRSFGIYYVFGLRKIIDLANPNVNNREEEPAKGLGNLALYH